MAQTKKTFCPGQLVLLVDTTGFACNTLYPGTIVELIEQVDEQHFSCKISAKTQKIRHVNVNIIEPISDAQYSNAKHFWEKESDFHSHTKLKMTLDYKPKTQKERKKWGRISL